MARARTSTRVASRNNKPKAPAKQRPKARTGPARIPNQAKRPKARPKARAKAAAAYYGRPAAPKTVRSLQSLYGNRQRGRRS